MEEAKGVPKDHLYEIEYLIWRKPLPICSYINSFDSFFSTAGLLKFAAAMAIVLQSVIFRAFMRFLVGLTSFKTDSARVRFLMVSVLMIFFYNFGVMFLIAPLNFGTDHLTLFLGGVYTDFNAHWFDEIGNLIIKQLIIATILPLILVIIFWMAKSSVRCYDQGVCCRYSLRPNKTKLRTFSSFAFVYGGGDFMIFNQYAHMVVLVWVAFLFAPGIPILFLISLWGLLVLYYVNRVNLAYFSQRPKDHNKKVLFTALRLMRVGPFLYVLMGAWVYSNPQVFMDAVEKLKYDQIFTDPEHTFEQLC